MRALELLDRVERYLIIGLLLALVALVFLQVVSRFVFPRPIEWSEELARFVFVWLCWISSSYAARDYIHIRVTAQFYFLPRLILQYVIVAADLLWIVFNCVVVYAALLYLSSILEYPYEAMVTGLSMFWVFLPIPVSFLTLSVRLIVNLSSRDHLARTLR